jgi:hypothetical protein
MAQDDDQDERKPDELKQTTAKGLEIPVPARADVFRDLRKVAPPPTPPPPAESNDDR